MRQDFSKIPLEDYFPPCPLPDCERVAEGKHCHILPHQKTIIDCDTKFLSCQGGVGSAKSIAFAAKCVKLSLEIPENEGVVGRRDFSMLYSSSWKDIKTCIKRLVYKGYIDELWYLKEMFSRKKQGDYTLITFPNGSTLRALQAKNWTEGLGTSIGFFWIDDAMEVPEELFVGNDVSAGLISRLRLPHVAFHKDDNGNVKNMLHGMSSTNPPPINHWYHKLFGKVEGICDLGPDKVTTMIVQTFLNPFVGKDYAKGLIAVQNKMGRSKNVARRVIFGESIPAYNGIPVYPQFDHGKHVGPVVHDAILPLIRCLDFGVTHPAALFAHLNKCPHGVNHFQCLSEITDLFDVTVYEFWAEVLRHVKDNGYNKSVIYDCGDKSGYRKSSSNKDKRSDAKILVDEFHVNFKYRDLDLIESIKYVRSLLQPRNECPCGKPIIIIDPRCEGLIGALEGGYHFSKNRTTGVVSDKPVKDKYFDDIADTFRYGVENFVKWGIKQHNWVSFSNTKPKPKSHPWDWMEISKQQIADLMVS